MAPPDASPSSYMNLSPPDVPQTAPPRRHKYHLGGLYDSDDGDLSELATKDHRRTKSSIHVDQGSAARGERGGYSASRRIPGGRTSPKDGGVAFFPPGDYLQGEPLTWKHGTGPKGLHKRRNDSVTERKPSIPPSSSMPPTSGSSVNVASPSSSQGPLPSPRSEPVIRSSPPEQPHPLPHSSSSSSDIVLTPIIGEGKDAAAPVAGPVVVGVVFDFPKAATNAAQEPSSNRSSASNSSVPGTDTAPPGQSSAPQPGGSSNVGATGAPPPRPPRHAASLRAVVRPGLTPSQTVPVAARPELTKTSSDFSIVAMNVTSSSGSVPVWYVLSVITHHSRRREPNMFGFRSVEESARPAQDPPGGQKAHHRREGADTGDSPVLDPKRPSTDNARTEGSTGNDTIRATGPLLSSLQTDASRPGAASRPFQHTRQGLPSQWSSHSDTPPDVPPKDVDPQTAARQSMEDLVLAVNQHIGNPGPTTNGVQAPTLSLHPKDSMDISGRNFGGRTTSRSPALERVDESDSVYSGGSMRQDGLGGTPKSQPPTPNIESHPALSNSRPSSSMSGQKGNPASMAGVGAAHGRYQQFDVEYDRNSIDHPPPAATGVPTTHRTPPAKHRRLSNGSVSKPIASVPHAAANLVRSPSSVSSSFRSFRQQTYTPNFDHDATPRTSRTTRVRRPPGQLPDAFWFKDVLARKTPIERAAGYAEKMRQLFCEEDSGLGDWVSCAKGGGKGRSDSRNRSPKSDTASSVGLARSASRASSSNGGFSFNPKPRNVSHGSEATEATFPIRADAYVATELSSRRHSPPRGPPANLPYPGVIQNMGMRTSATMRSFPSTKSNGADGAPAYSNSMRSLKSPKATGTGFFASIGRRTSIKKERPPIGTGIGNSNGTNRPNQVPLPPAVLPRPPQLGSRHLAGGPRPPPSKTGGPMRHNSLLEGRSRISNDGGSNQSSPRLETRTVDGHELVGGAIEEDASTIGHGTEDFDNSSLRSAPTHLQSDITGSTSSGADLIPRSSLSYRTMGRTDPTSMFNANLSKVSDVLPHVDRRILAAYLKRAGGDDIKAISKYLEDDRNGVVDIRI